MKSIVAIIRQEKYQDVKNELTAVGCQGMNVSEFYRWFRTMVYES